MPSRDWRIRIDDMIDAAERIVRYCMDLDFESFAADEITVDAVVRRIAVIGEAARHVPEEIAARHPEIAWRELRGMRNVVIHDYPSADEDLLWDTVRRDIPLLLDQLQNLVAAEK